ARHIGDNQRRQHAQHRSTDAVEQLKNNEQRRIEERGEQQRTHRQSSKTDQQKRPPAPAFRRSPDPRRQQSHEDLRQDDQRGNDERRAPFPLVDESLYEGERRSSLDRKSTRLNSSHRTISY